MDANVKEIPNVLLTGATSGIGNELGKCFARHGHRLIIVGRRQRTLEEAAKEFEALGAPRVRTIVADLSKSGGPGTVKAAIAEWGEHIGILVNDAGRGLHGEFVATELRKELEMVQLNIASVLELTKIFLPGMVDRGQGRVVQLASIASYQPTPLLAVYAASKAFILSFTDALRDELKETGVTVTAVIPGATDTDFFRKAGMQGTQAAQDPQDPAIIAGIAYEALMKGEPHAVAPGLAGSILLSNLLPNRTVASKAHAMMLPTADPAHPVS